MQLSVGGRRQRPVAPLNREGSRHRGSTVCDGRRWSYQPGAFNVCHQPTISTPSCPETQTKTANVSGIVQVKT